MCLRWRRLWDFYSKTASCGELHAPQSKFIIHKTVLWLGFMKFSHRVLRVFLWELPPAMIYNFFFFFLHLNGVKNIKKQQPHPPLKKIHACSWSRQKIDPSASLQVSNAPSRQGRHTREPIVLPTWSVILHQKRPRGNRCVETSAAFLPLGLISYSCGKQCVKRSHVIFWFKTLTAARRFCHRPAC